MGKGERRAWLWVHKWPVGILFGVLWLVWSIIGIVTTDSDLFWTIMLLVSFGAIIGTFSCTMCIEEAHSSAEWRGWKWRNEQARFELARRNAPHLAQRKKWGKQVKDKWVHYGVSVSMYDESRIELELVQCKESSGLAPIFCWLKREGEIYRKAQYSVTSREKIFEEHKKMVKEARELEEAAFNQQYEKQKVFDLVKGLKSELVGEDAPVEAMEKKECAECGNVAEVAPGDYICVECRGKSGKKGWLSSWVNK
jgi:hypothetical protein